MKFLLLILFLSYTQLAHAVELAEKTHSLDGTSITYNYTSNRSYHVKFESVGISYRFLTGSKPNKWWGPFPYTAFEVEKDQYMAAWFEEDYGDYVTLLINFKTKLLYGSAILEGKSVHFHGAQIVDVQRASK